MTVFFLASEHPVVASLLSFASFSVNMCFLCVHFSLVLFAAVTLSIPLTDDCVFRFEKQERKHLAVALFILFCFFLSILVFFFWYSWEENKMSKNTNEAFDSHINTFFYFLNVIFFFFYCWRSVFLYFSFLFFVLRFTSFPSSLRRQMLYFRALFFVGCVQ